MKPRKLIEIALPIKEISAESVRDKSIRHGHISTLHLWWARRPLPVCRAIVFASLVPDPLDENCPQAFKDAVFNILCPKDNQVICLEYKPYDDIPYTPVYDPMEENLRNRLMMFIGKFSGKCQENMKKGKATSPKEQLMDSCLIKWENKNNPRVLKMARELIWVAYNSQQQPNKSYERLHKEFEEAFQKISDAENELYSIIDRHRKTAEVEDFAANLESAISEFQSRMPSVFDPFAGGGAIPLEAARLGCRSFGNDINPVAHIIERSSTEYPQKYGKPITFSESEFKSIYGEKGLEMIQDSSSKAFLTSTGYIQISNRLSFDVEFYCKKLLSIAEDRLGTLYPKDENGKKPIAYYWARTAKCSNPSCGAEVPLLKQFYLVNTPKKKVYLNPIIQGKDIQFEIKEGISNLSSFLKPRECSLTCPCCGSITDGKNIKSQFANHQTGERMVAVIWDGINGKEYTIPSDIDKQAVEFNHQSSERPNELMPQNDSQNLKIPHWGYRTFGDMYSDRQINMMNVLIDVFNKEFSDITDKYRQALSTYVAIWIDRISMVNTSFGRWNVAGEKIEHPFSKQAIPMIFDYPESNPFCSKSGSALNQLEWILRYLESESPEPFYATVTNASSGEKSQFDNKSLDAVVTDPPYYDAISYADLSDFFYVWLKRTLGDIYPLVFSTPQTPKIEECTAIKHRFNGNIALAKKHFEEKLTSIFDAIEYQTTEIVSIMFAHQSTEAWTTLCNSILGARMNITGSWPMDTEMANRSIGLAGAALESSVTVACRPSERKGFGDFKEVKYDITNRVAKEVEYLYDLGFRGADLLTACFGQAVSEFGRYKVVEKADGSEVSVGDLLEMARNAAFDALLKGVQGDDFTKFYIGWLQLNGTGEADFDDATKFTRVGVNVDINEIKHKGLLIQENKKMHIAMAKEHLGSSGIEGTRVSDSLIAQAHRLILLFRVGDRAKILSFVRNIAPESTSPLWRLLATLKELLPAGEDAKDVQGLLQNADDFRQNCHKEIEYTQGSLFDETF